MHVHIHCPVMCGAFAYSLCILQVVARELLTELYLRDLQSGPAQTNLSHHETELNAE